VSGVLGGERLAVMEAEYTEAGNGHGNPPPLVMPSKSYRLTARTKQVALEGDFAGVVVTMRTNAPVGEYLALIKLSNGVNENKLDAVFGEVIERLPRLIAAWNLEDESGHPVPITPEGIRDNVPMDLLMALMGKMGGGETVPKSS
jgi:hypothetical protein